MALKSTQESKATLAQFLSPQYAPIQDAMMEVLSVEHIHLLRKTSKAFSGLYDTAWTIDEYNNLLLEFFHDATAFRCLQSSSEAILWGPPITRYLLRDKQAKATSDKGNHLFVVASTGAAPRIEEKVAEFMYKSGYVRSSESRFVILYETWCRYIGANRQTVSFEYAFPGEPTINRFIYQASFTAGMNFATWNKIYSVFPYTTFVKMENYPLKPMEEKMVHDIDAFCSMGLKTKSIHWRQHKGEGQGIRSLAKYRRIGDRHTWMLPLSVEGVPKADVPDGVLESTLIHIHLNATVGETHYYLYSQEKIMSPVLKYPFSIYQGHDADPSETIQTLKNYLVEQTHMELWKLPAEQRTYPRFILQDRPARASDLEIRNKPDNWTYYDDDVIEYLRDWSKEMEGA